MTFADQSPGDVQVGMLDRIDAFIATEHLRNRPPLSTGEVDWAGAKVFGAGWTMTRETTTVQTRNLLALLRARPRKNQKLLSDAEKRAFNDAVQMAIDAGRWEWFTNLHSGRYMMHRHMNPSLGPPLGTYRFLPWHRVYLYRMEVWLNFFMPGVTIPYWDWANDRTLPSWVLLPPGVTRGPDPTYVIPTPGAINAILSHSTYESFADRLERAHDAVHMFVGGNTMPEPAISARDPLFFLHHANVDRIWAEWQATPGRPEAPLTGTDAVMTPFTNYRLSGTRDTFGLGYYYE